MKKLAKVFLFLLVLTLIGQESFAGSWLWPEATSDVKWEGSTADWEDQNNFSNNQLPDSETNVIIDPANYTVAPALSSNSSYQPLGITLENGGSLTLNGDLNMSLLEIGGGTNSITINSGSQMTVEDGVHFNSSGGTIDISGDGDLTSNSDFTFDEANTTLDNSGNLTINGDLVFDAANGSIGNNGSISVTGNLMSTGLTTNSNEVQNHTGGSFLVGNNINFSGAANDIINEGTFTLGGSFLGINIAGKTENRASGTWIWNYTGSTWDLDILSIFVDNGTFMYGASASQSVIPMTYENLNLSGSGTKTLVNDAVITGTLTLNGGKLALGDYNLTIGSGGNISGGSSLSYIMSNGSGALTQQNLGASGRMGDVVFPVGTSTSYTPLTINNSTGTADNFSIELIDQVYEDGYSGTPQASDLVGRTWFISEAVPGGSDATLTFQWNDTDGMGTFSPAEVHVIHYNGTEWERLWTGAASGLGPYTASATNVSDFSPFGIEGGASPLPVELVSFKGVYNGESVDLSWITASELNNDYFILERSEDLVSYKQVAIIDGHGTTNETMTYKTQDYGAFAGINYYRLTQVDFDGTAKVYEAIKVEVPLGDNVAVFVYPVPTAGNFVDVQLTGYEKSLNTKLDIVDIKGEVVYQEDIFLDKNAGFAKRITFNNKLPRGMYVLNINTPNPITRRIMVN